MLLEVNYWKNWDASYGARITVKEIGNVHTDFPTRCIFSNNLVDNVNENDHDESDSIWAQIDYSGRTIVEDWVKETIRDVKALVESYRNEQVPESRIIEI